MHRRSSVSSLGHSRKTSISTNDFGGPLDGPSLVLQQIIDIEYQELSDDALVSIFEGIYTKSSPVPFSAMIDREVELIQETIMLQIQQERKVIS